MYLCGPFRKITPTRVLPDIVLCGVRTFLEQTFDMV
jgi:hypothetical protein